MNDVVFVEDLAASVQIAPGSIVSKPLQTGPKCKTVLFGFDAGQELSEHTASVPAIVQILSGEATITLGGQAHEAQAGSWTYMPAQLPHAISAKTPVVMLLILLKEPGAACNC